MVDFLCSMLWVLIGFLFGVLLYWKFVGQFWNELRALRNLVWFRFKRGFVVNIAAESRLFSLDNPTEALELLPNETAMKVWNDMGVDWIHTNSGWKRARIVHVFHIGDESEVKKVFKISHLDIMPNFKAWRMVQVAELAFKLLPQKRSSSST